MKSKRVRKLINEAKQEFGLDNIQDYTTNDMLFNDGFIASLLCPHLGPMTKEQLKEYCKQHNLNNDVDVLNHISAEFDIWNQHKK